MSVTRKSYNIFLIVSEPESFKIYLLEVDEERYLTLVGCSRSVQHRGGWFDNWIKEQPVFWEGEERDMRVLTSTTFPIVVRMES